MSIADRIPQIYAKGIRKQTKFYYANWLPTQEIMIGAVGEVVDNHFFRPLTTLADLGIDFDPARDILPDPFPSTLDLVSNRGVKINFKAAGSVNPNVPTVPTAKAGLSIEFAREASFVLKAEKVFEPRIRDVEGLGRQIIAAYRAGKWKWYYKLVYSIVEAPYADIFISKSSNSKVELEVTASGNVGTVELGNPEIKFGITSESGNVLKMPGSENCHPMFRLIGIKKNVITDTVKFEPFGVQAAGMASGKPDLEDDTPYLSVGLE